MIKKLLVRIFKNLFLFPVLLFSGIFIFLPNLCYANYSMGSLMNSGLFIILICLGILIIEAYVIKQKLGIEPKKALSASFVINLITTIFGYFFVFEYDLYDKLSFLLNNFSELGAFFIFLLVLFLSAIIVEAIILFFFYKKISFSKLLKTSFFMNLGSCSFLFVSFFSTMSGILLVIITFIIFCISIFYILTAFFADKITKKNIIIISILLPLILSGIISYDISKEEANRLGGRNARRMSDIWQIRTACKLYYSDNENKYPVAYDFENIKSIGIGDYMYQLPDDPKKGDTHYIWIDNTGIGNNQYFCVYAELEYSDDNWFVGSEKGTTKTNIEPTGLGDACWHIK
ncbi:MAG: hypothetical protein U9Q27_00695 [Patescibacteria group bacterium]|nr:hypothetical protein [Patescibacteria group bacterium]